MVLVIGSHHFQTRIGCLVQVPQDLRGSHGVIDGRTAAAWSGPVAPRPGDGSRVCQHPGSYAQPRAWRASGSSRVSGPRLVHSWRRSMPGSPKASTLPTCKRPGRCWRRLGGMGTSPPAYQHTETLLVCRTPDSFALDTRVRAVPRAERCIRVGDLVPRQDV